MKENINFTIVIPHYNSAHLLPKLISTIPLEKEDLQVIIVDDRSDEHLEELVELRKKYKGRIEFYRNNHGKKSAGTARNIGLKHAKGKWLIFADADDYFSNKFPELIERYKDSECEIVYFSADSIEAETKKRTNRHTNISNLVRDYCSNKITENELRLKYRFVEPYSKMIKREMVEINHIRFSDSLAGNDGWFSTLTAYKSKKIDVCDEVFYIIVEREGSLTTAKNKASFESRLIEALKRRLFLKKVLSLQDLRYLDLSPKWLFISAAEKNYELGFILRWLIIYELNGVYNIRIEDLADIIKIKISWEKDTIYRIIKKIDWKEEHNLKLVDDLQWIKNIGLICFLDRVLVDKGWKKYPSLTLSRRWNKYYYDKYCNCSKRDLEKELATIYKKETGLDLDFDCLRTYNEKLQWIKLYDIDELKTQLADKYRVREWVREKIGSDYLIPLLGVWKNFDDIDFQKLPDQFVLKTNHGSGTNIIVKDKSRFDKKESKGLINSWLGKNFAYIYLEFQYRDIKPLIIAEQYIEDKEGELNDYKFFAFNGKIKYIQVDMDRFSNHIRNIYDTNWKLQDFSIEYPNDINRVIEKPQNFEEMIKIAEKLAEGFREVRVDLYNVDGKIFFGEMTFTHGAGYERFSSEKIALEWGSYFSIY